MENGIGQRKNPSSPRHRQEFGAESTRKKQKTDYRLLYGPWTAVTSFVSAESSRMNTR